MLLLPRQENTALRRSLYAVKINTSFAYTVLNGSATGRVWADAYPDIRALHLLHNYNMSLIWGPDVGSAFEELTAHLVAGTYRKKDEWLQIDPRWGHLDWDRALGARHGGKALRKHVVQRFTRVNFRFDVAGFRALPVPKMAPGWHVRPMTAADYFLPDVSVAPQHFWGSAEAFLAAGGGMCAEKEGVVGAVAFCATCFDASWEIGIETRAPFRRLGLARAVAAAMAAHCIENGKVPLWSCRKENTGSYTLAQSVGFRISRELPYYRLPAQK